MATITFSIGFGVSVTLTEVSGGVRVDVSGAGKDITAVFFDLNPANNGDSNTLINSYTVSGSEVRQFDFEEDRINTINGINLNPAGGFDAGVAIADTGTSFIGSTSFVISGAGLTLEDFSGQRFGVRLSGNQGSSKILGTAPIIDATAPNIPQIGTIATDNIVNSSEKTAGVTVSGTAEAHSKVRITWGTTILTTTANGSGTWSQNFTSAQIPADGSTTVSAIATDAFGNTSAPGTRTVLIDTIAPTVTITDNVAGVANLTTNNITYTYTFSEAVTGLAANDFTVTNGTLSSVSGSGTTWQVKVTPTANIASGNISLVLANGAVTDIAGNPNVSVTNNAQAIDTLAPTVAIALADPELTAGETTTVTFTFSEIPAGFDISDIAAANGTITSLIQTSDPKVYTATFTPNDNILDDTNVITVGTGYRDGAGNAGAIGTSPNFTIDTLYGTLTVTSLGYEGFVDSSAGEDLAGSILVRGTVPLASDTTDGNPDGYLFFLRPEPGSFTQTITLTAENRASAPNTILSITGSNPFAPFVKLKRINWTLNGVLTEIADGQAGDLDGAVNGVIKVSLPSIPKGDFVIKAISDVVGGIGLEKERLTFQLQDQNVPDPTDPTKQLDYGNATGSLELYLTRTGFTKASGSTEFSFGSLGLSNLAVDLNSDNTIEASQAATIVRGAGYLTEGSGGQSVGTKHGAFLTDALNGNADTLLSGRTTFKSDPFIGDFTLAWQQAPGIPLTDFANNSGVDAFDDSIAADAKLDSVIELIRAGLFSLQYAAAVTQKGETGGISGTRGGVTFNQTAVAGNITDNPVQYQYATYVPPQPFDQFIAGLTPTSPPWIVTINDPSVLGPNSQVTWSKYTSSTLIAAIILPSDSPSAQFYAKNGNTSSNLDLRSIAFLTTDGGTAGVNIRGTNNSDLLRASSGNDVVDGGNGGTDTLDGWLGNDVLIGGNGKDTYVVGPNYGIDTFQNFKGTNDVIDARSLGITNANVLSLLDTNRNGSVGLGDQFVSNVVNSGSTRSLTLNLSSFSDAVLGLTPPNGSLTQIVIRGESRLLKSNFV
ncbi:MAG TPA: hypothetical protein IGS53_29625 [Leptolyngbyaceae cyanobacterium M33_DOE_097]|uniref:Bacterial Ig-like domain-containing protein n=1 Tax=Oscillatoriales cyanobacterium SpSt-418 TaxID=2282169 RepID=A0A7C3KEW8_9CYAN|nr:hypothetical protein [Leptolyngbyaceae cyanobacterium M33_DOE_097]